MFIVNLKALVLLFTPFKNTNTRMKLNIRDLHIYYLAWRLPISGPQAWRLAAAKNACGSWR
jgi:hypothetical protein